MKRRLVLVDASIYIFRSWFTLPDTILDAQGRPANAAYGFADFLTILLDRERPGHIACAFDESLSKSFRNEIFPAYKANREKAPEDLKHQFRQCQAISEAFGVKVLKSDRFEADDLIGTAAARFRERGFDITVVTGDKDLAQCIRPGGDLFWNFARDERLDYRGVTRKLGVRPEQVPDWLALAGDAVDNIPGIPGVGAATAARLLALFDNVEAIYADVDRVAEMKFRGAKRVRDLLVEHEETVRTGLRITPVALNAPVPRSENSLAWQGARPRKLASLAKEMDFGEQRVDRWNAMLRT
ncbi:MAG: flap endonuclease [Gammaproteobacteria bacterium]|nr:flap endonuclease [Gammaproteobacteria bacterium]